LRTPPRELLLAIAQPDRDPGEISRLCGNVDPGALVDAIVWHQIVSLAHERLRSVEGAPPSVVEELGHRRVAAQLSRLHLERVGAKIGSALGELSPLAVKGSVLAQWYPDPSLREFKDIDILVRPGDLETALDLLQAADVVPIGQNWAGFRAFEVAEIPLVVDGSWIDLHWNLVGMGESRKHIRMPTDELLQRAVPQPSGGFGLLTLDPQDTLLHLCVNYGLDGGRRLRALVDIDTVARSGRVDLVEFGRRALLAGAGPLSAAILQRTSRLLGTPMAPEVLRELSTGRIWLSANRMVDRLGGVRRTSGQGIASGVLLGSGRDSTSSTLAALGRSVARAAGRTAGRPGLTERGGALDWQRKPEGDAEVHRRDYLAWVLTQDPQAHESS
jgi:hypothetical protein